MDLHHHAPPRAVFVDPSGRRGRRVRRACWALGSLAGAYVVAVVLALVVPAGLTRLSVPGLGRVLPGPAAPLMRDAAGHRAPAARLLVRSSPDAADPTAAPVAESQTARQPSSTATAASGSRPVRVAPTPGPTVAVASTPPGQARPSPTPASSTAAGPTPASSTAPGRASAHPTPKPTSTPTHGRRPR